MPSCRPDPSPSRNCSEREADQGRDRVGQLLYQFLRIVRRRRRGDRSGIGRLSVGAFGLRGVGGLGCDGPGLRRQDSESDGRPMPFAAYASLSPLRARPVWSASSHLEAKWSVTGPTIRNNPDPDRRQPPSARIGAKATSLMSKIPRGPSASAARRANRSAPHSPTCRYSAPS